jgi:hypothetical protein
MTNDRVVVTALKPAVLDDLPAGDMDARIAAIVATPRRAGAARARRRSRKPRTLVAAGGVAAVLAATALTVTAVATGGDGKEHPLQLTPPRWVPTAPSPVKVQTAALTFTKKGGYLTVRVKDPVADPARYKKEFAAHGLDVDLRLAPASRREAGSVTFLEDDGGGGVKTVTAPGHCGTRACGVGIKIPLRYKGFVRVVFGRTALPGEHYDTGPGDTPGEGVGLSNVSGRTVADVLAEAKRKHIGNISYRYEDHGSDKPYSNGVPADKVQSDWYVHDALAGTGNQVIIFVGPRPTNR